MSRCRFRPFVTIASVLVLCATISSASQPRRDVYQDLLRLFEEFVVFERPPLKNGAPDYSVASLSAKRAGLKNLQARLEAIDASQWPIDQQVDQALVRAMMNGFDFNLRVLKPWARDPAYYQSIWTGQSD